MGKEKIEEFCLAAQKGDLASVREFIIEGIDVNAQKIQTKDTALHLAALKGHTDIAIELLLNDADPNIQNEYLDTALHYASLRGYYKIVVQLLLNNKAKTNIINSDGKTALDLAKDGAIKRVLQSVAEDNNLNQDGFADSNSDQEQEDLIEVAGDLDDSVLE